MSSHKCETIPGARDCELCDRNYLVVLICDNIPNQKFWSKNSQDWSSNMEDGAIYYKYSEAIRTQWFEIPEDKVTHRITICSKSIYKRLLAGEKI